MPVINPENNDQNNQNQNNSNDQNNQQKKNKNTRSILNAIQDYIEKRGFTDSEIVSVDDRYLQDTNHINDPMMNGGINTISNYNSQWRTVDDNSEYDEETGYLSRDTRYRDYKQMIEMPELDSGLEVYANESTQPDKDGHLVQIMSDNSKIKDMLERLFYQKLDIDTLMWDITYEMCWLGDSFREIYFDKESQKEILSLQKIKADRVQRIEEENKLKKFIVDGKDVVPFKVVHFRNRSTRFEKYGASIFEAGRGVWKQLKLLEDSMIVHRLTRSSERKIFYVDVGRLPPDQVEQAMERFMQRFQKKKTINISSGKVDTVTNVLSQNENYYIPRVEGRSNTELTTLQAGQALHEIDDVAYFKDKLMAMLKIPRDYVSYSSSAGQSGLQTGKYLSEQDIRFSRVVTRIQEKLIDGLKKVAVVYLAVNGISPDEAEQFEITMTKSSAIEELRRIEVQTQVYSLVGAIKQLDMFPDVWILKEILNFDDDQVSEIVRLMKIQKMQLSPESLALAGPGGIYPGEPVPGVGGEIPPEAAAALGGAPGAMPGGIGGEMGGGEMPAGAEAGAAGGEAGAAGAGAGAGIAAMLNAMENEIHKVRRGRDDAKAKALNVKYNEIKKKVKDKIANIKENGDFFEMIDDLKMLNEDMYDFMKEIKSPEEADDIKNKVKLINEKFNKKNKMINEHLDLIDDRLERKRLIENAETDMIGDMIELDNYIDKKSKPVQKRSVLENLEAFFNFKPNKINPKNNYIKKLLMEGELKGRPQTLLNEWNKKKKKTSSKVLNEGKKVRAVVRKNQKNIKKS